MPAHSSIRRNGILSMRALLQWTLEFYKRCVDGRSGKADRHRHPASNWPIMRLHNGYDKPRLAALSVNSVLAFPFTSCHCLSFIFIRARPISVSEHTGRTPSVFESLHKFLPSPVGRQRRFLHLAVFLRSNLIRPDAERLRSRKQMTD